MHETLPCDINTRVGMGIKITHRKKTLLGYSINTFCKLCQNMLAHTCFSIFHTATHAELKYNFFMHYTL